MFEEVALLNIFTLAVTVLAFLILCHVLRELVLPTAVLSNAPHWRPQLELWGVPKQQRDQWEQSTLAAQAIR